MDETDDETDNASDAKLLAAKAISRWVDAVCLAQSISPAEWERRAKGAFNRSTVSRARQMTGNTTKIENIHQMARAVGVPSVVDFLNSQSGEKVEPWLPNAETIADLLAAAMFVDEDDQKRLDELQIVASAVHTGLQYISDAPESESDPGFLKGVRMRIREAINAAKNAPSKVA